jgi:hypothetical protein
MLRGNAIPVAPLLIQAKNSETALLHRNITPVGHSTVVPIMFTSVRFVKLPTPHLAKRRGFRRTALQANGSASTVSQIAGMDVIICRHLG